MFMHTVYIYILSIHVSIYLSIRIKKCLQKGLKSLHKERHHSILQFRRLLAGGAEAARREVEATVQHLKDIDLR